MGVDVGKDLPVVISRRAILAATAGNVRDHVIYSVALGTGLRLAEIVGKGALD